MKNVEEYAKDYAKEHAKEYAQDIVDENNEHVIINLRKKGFTIDEIIDTVNVSKDFVEKTLAK